MSSMSDIAIEIQCHLEDGVHPTKIARIMQIPLTWVYDTLETMPADDRDYEQMAQAYTMLDVGCEFDPKY